MCRLAEDIAVQIKTKCLTRGHSERDVLKLVAKYLNIADDVTVRSANWGRMTSRETREKVWAYYHKVAQESTNTTYLARLGVGEEPKIQIGLSFRANVKEISVRNRSWYQNIWLTVTFKELDREYLAQHPFNIAS